MFEPAEAPRVFGLPPGADFAAALVEGLAARLDGRDPAALARVEIIVNTRRMERRLAEVFAARGPALLPRITPIGALAERYPAPGLPPSRPALDRKLDLLRLVDALIDADPTLAPGHAAPALADSLAALIDEMAGEGVDPRRLMDLEVPDASQHWQRSLRFLSIVVSYLANAGDAGADGEARARAAALALIARWQAAPPRHPVLFAGSTGSRGTTQALMAAVAGLPQGALVLPGFDFDQPEAVWRRLAEPPVAEEHPQARFSLLMTRLGIGPRDVARWSEADRGVAGDGAAARRAMVSLALRPAPVTDAWRRDGPALGDLGAACAEIELIEAPSPRIEAQAIALRLRAAAEAGTAAALVTPDRTLTRQVAAALARWDIDPDDSAGRPLALSPPGRLLRQVAGLIGRPVEAAALIALLKHPLVNSTEDDRGAHLRFTRELERHLRREALARPSPEDLAGWAEAFGGAAPDWIAWVNAVMGGMRMAAAEPGGGAAAGGLGGFVDLHLGTTEALARGPAGAGPGRLWDEAAGEVARAAMDTVRRAVPAADGLAVDALRYAELVSSVLAAEEVRDPVRPYPGVMIWGTLEARVQSADLVILAGLNEGVWPEHPDPDSWLSRQMRRKLGLLSPDRRIGLSAHDFQQAVAARRVVLSRAARSDDAATVPSRWLNRITNLLGGLPGTGGPEALAGMRARGQVWVDLAHNIDARAEPVAAATRPAPRPPVAARPRQLSVTETQTLIRDPFAIYARHVLGLRRLDPLDRKPDAALRGTVLHSIVERFLSEGGAAAADGVALHEAQARLLSIADAVLAETVVWPEARRIWRARVASVAERFLQAEEIRRAEGDPFPPERRGRWDMPAPAFTLTGKADRIDRLRDGTLAIYDYKTGRVPTQKETRSFDRQLLLEAVMAEDGAFEGVAAAPVSKMGYIALGPSQADSILHPGVDGADTVATIRAEFQRLIEAYLTPSQGYAARRAVRETRFEGDYDQLARFGEWDDSDAPEGIVLP